MAEAESVTEIEDENFNTQPIETDGQAEFCPSCKETYNWIYGEDCMPTSLSCGHTLCFQCAKSQWRTLDTKDAPAYCIACSAHVAVTSFKPPSSSSPEHNNRARCFNKPMEPQSTASSSASNGGIALYTTPTKERSSSEMIQQHASGGKQTNPVSLSVDRVTSALSSPLVLDKIQSQDDAWRLLQHDEGFICDWIMANVPDHVIFKMVGAGNSDANLEGSSFSFSNGTAVVTPSPSKTDDVSMTVSEVADMSSSTSLPGTSAGFGETLTRPSFEQQFVQYLVDKTSHDRPSENLDDSGEQDLHASPACVESAVQTGHEPTVEDSKEIPSVSVISQSRAAATEAIENEVEKRQSYGVGNESDCSILPPVKEDPQLVAVKRMVTMSSDGGPCRLPADTFSSMRTRPVMASSATDIWTGATHYETMTDPSQPLERYQQQSTAVGNSSLLSVAGTSYPNRHQLNYTTGLVGATRLTGSYTDQRIQFSNHRTLSGACGPYRNYSYPYAYCQSLHEQYRHQCSSAPQRFRSVGFQRQPRYMFHNEGRFRRGRGTAFPHPFRIPSEYSWSSKACNVAINPAPLSRFPSQPQIRFVQVVRPKPDSTSASEPPEPTQNTTVIDSAAGTAVKDMASPETREGTEAEVAVMKTRDMPHGIQVEDIYVVPQVWLSNGQTPLQPDSSHQNSCPACPYPSTYPSHPAMATPLTHQDIVQSQSSHFLSTKQEDAEKCTRESANNGDMPALASADVGKRSGKPSDQTKERQETSKMACTVLSEGVQDQKHGTDDNSNYADFKPVALVTTIPVSQSKIDDEPCAETAANVAVCTMPPLVHSSTVQPIQSFPDSQGIGWQSNIETPVGDILMTDNFQGLPTAGVPGAPVKKIQEQSHVLEDIQLESATLPQYSTDPSTSIAAAASIVGPCSQNTQCADDSKLSRPAEIDVQTVAIEDVEIMETKSTLPSAIMLPKQDITHLFPGRRKLRRNLSSEFYHPSFGAQNRHVRDSSDERRSFSNRGKWYPSRYIPYCSAYSNHQQTAYHHSYPFNHHPRSYHYRGGMAWRNATINYRQPPSRSSWFSQPDPEKHAGSQFGLPLDDDTVHRHNGTAYSFLHGFTAYDSQIRGPSSLSQPYSDVLNHLGSGQDYSSRSCADAQQILPFEYQQDQARDCGLEGHSEYTSENFSREETPRLLHFWPVRGEEGDNRDNNYTGVWKIGSAGHVVSARDLETLQWLLQEVSELNKQIESDMLARLEGCLALVQRNMYEDEKHPLHGPVRKGQEVHDMDCMWHCILSLGQVVVHYGWWCRPHYWDGSSERWAEMAMLASTVFEDSLEKLNKVITFYLDHVCATLKGCETEAHCGFERRVVDVSTNNSHTDSGSSSSPVPGYNQYQQPVFYSQPQQSLSFTCTKPDQSSSFNITTDSSQLNGTFYDKSGASDASGNYGHATSMAAMETYSSAALSHCENGIPSFFQPPGCNMKVGQTTEDAGTAEIQSISVRHLEDCWIPETQAHDSNTGRITNAKKQVFFTHTDHPENMYAAGEEVHGTDASHEKDGNDTGACAQLYDGELQASVTDEEQLQGAYCTQSVETQPLLLEGMKLERDPNSEPPLSASCQTTDTVLLEDGNRKMCNIKCDPASYDMTGTAYRDCDLLPSPSTNSVNQAMLASVEADVPVPVKTCPQEDKSAVVTIEAADQQRSQMEIYYTVEGTLIDTLTTDSLVLTTATTSCSSTGEQCSENILYAVSRIEGSTEATEFTTEEALGYVMSSECADKTAPTSQEQVATPLKAVSIAVVDSVHMSPNSVLTESEPSQYYLKIETSTNSLPSSAVPVAFTAESSCGLTDTNVTAGDTQTIYHNEESEMNLFTVTVAAEQCDTDKGMECSAEVISDAAIMLSETVEVETDGTVEVMDMQDTECSDVPSGEEASASYKENVNVGTSTGKRKCCKTTQSNNRFLKQGLYAGKQEMKAASTKGGKWNLRSTKKSPFEAHH